MIFIKDETVVFIWARAGFRTDLQSGSVVGDHL